MSEGPRVQRRHAGATVFGPLRADGLRSIIAKIDKTDTRRWEIKDRHGKPVAWRETREAAVEHVLDTMIAATA